MQVGEKTKKKKKKISKKGLILDESVELNSTRPDQGNLFPPVCCCCRVCCLVFFSRCSLVAGGLASGQHAHNPQQSSSHHFIFPVLWSSLASVCRYGNFASEFH